MVIVLKALSKEQIDEVISVSKEMNRGANESRSVPSLYATSDDSIRESPQVERTLVNAQPSPSPDYLPPPERSPTPDRMSSLKRRERRRRSKAQASQGDAVLIEYMGGLNHPDLGLKAGEEPLPEESDESTDEDEVNWLPSSDLESEESTNEHGVESENGSDLTKLLRTAVPGVERGISPKDDQYWPFSNESTEAPQLETRNPVDPFVKHAGIPVDGNLQVLRPQELVKKTKRTRRRFISEERAEISAMRKNGVCNDCRRAKRRVSVLAGCGVRYYG